MYLNQNETLHAGFYLQFILVQKELWQFLGMKKWDFFDNFQTLLFEETRQEVWITAKLDNNAADEWKKVRENPWKRQVKVKKKKLNFRNLLEYH